MGTRGLLFSLRICFFEKMVGSFMTCSQKEEKSNGVLKNGTWQSHIVFVRQMNLRNTTVKQPKEWTRKIRVLICSKVASICIWACRPSWANRNLLWQESQRHGVRGLLIGPTGDLENRSSRTTYRDIYDLDLESNFKKQNWRLKYALRRMFKLLCYLDRFLHQTAFIRTARDHYALHNSRRNGLALFERVDRWNRISFDD